MCDYPFFIPQVVLFANSSLFWFKVTNEHREFRNYLFICIITEKARLSELFARLRINLQTDYGITYGKIHLFSAILHDCPAR